MEIIEFELPQEQPIPESPKGPRKPTIIKMSIIASIVILIIVLIALYLADEGVRDFIDVYIFQKQIEENKAVTIELHTEKNQNVYAYYKYITVLTDTKLESYTSSGRKDSEIEITISNPIYASNNRFLCIAEQNGKTLALISEQNKIWETQVEGNISKVNVNQNGYVSVIVTGTSHKTVVIIYDSNGKELFKTFLSNTNVVHTDISQDNKYLAIAEIDTTGAVIQSNIKIIEIEKARKEEEDAFVYIHKSNSNELITSIQYQERNNLVCMYDDSIHIITKNKSEEKVSNFSEKNVLIADIHLQNHYVQAIEQTTGLFSSKTQLIISNVQNKNNNIYSVNRVVKEMKVYKNIIAINTGTEVHFINTNGWLVKKYVSSQEIQQIVVGDTVAGIVYRGKIEIVDIG